MPGTFGRFVLPSLFASGAVFTALSLPLVVYGSERVDFPITDSVGVSGVLKDLAAPYLGLSGLISLAVGGAGLTLAGVGHSKKQSDALEKQYLESKMALQNREAEIQAILMSDKGLANAGLSFFLDDVPSVQQNPVVESVPAAAIAHVQHVSIPPIAAPAMVAVDAQPVSFSVNATVAGIQPVKVPQVTVQTSISPMPAAHGFLGFMRSGQAVPSAAIAWLEESEAPASQVAQLQNLQSQLHGLMAQIEQLQMTIQSQAVGVQSQVSPARIEVITQSEMPKNNVTAHRFQPFEHAWAGAPQRLAS